MPVVTNSYGKYSPIGEALHNLGSAFLSGPTPHQQQSQASALALNRARAEKVQAETAALTGQNTGRSAFADALTAGDVAAALPHVAAFVKTPEDFAEAILAYQANIGAPTADVQRSFAGSGRALGVNQGLTTEQHDRVRADKAQSELAEAMSVQGLRNQGDIAVQGMRNANALELQRIKPDSRTPRNYVVPGGPSGITLDGMTDAATGAPIPQGAQINTTQYSPQTRADLTGSTQTALEGQDVAFADFAQTLGDLREVAAADSTIFGATGNMRRLGQGVGMQIDSLAQMAGMDLSGLGAVRDAASQAGIDPGFFDPNLTDVEKMSNLAAYKAAAALAGQEGRGLSDNDFRRFRQIIGDPTAWLGSQAEFLAGLNRLERELQNAQQINQNMRTTGRASGGAPAASAPASGGAQPAPVPQAGEVVDGYRFQGGDPNDPSAWVPVQ